jgi:phosphate transport system protein
MTQLEVEIQELKNEVTNMWNLVISQMEKSRVAMLQFDTNLAREIVLKEKRVNALELKIDLDCENIFALFCPVAIDLRFLLAVLKINNNLERIGDIAEGIAKYIITSNGEYDPSLFDATELMLMYDDAINILTDTRIAFEKEDTILARGIFKRDEVLDKINQKANERIVAYIKSEQGVLTDALNVLSIIRKLERVGDQSKNIAEEIIFYVEAKVLKHQGRQ